MTLDTLHDVTGLDAGEANGHRAAPTLDDAYPVWARRRDATFTLFLWIIMAVACLFAISFIIRPVLVVALACLLAYAVAPLVRTLARALPRRLAILVLYLALLAVLGGLGYLFVSNAIAQFSALRTQITQLLTPPSTGARPP
jgi:predicted PurR-regulated permease PerM